MKRLILVLVLVLVCLIVLSIPLTVERPIQSIKVRAWWGTDAQPTLRECADWMCQVVTEEMPDKLTVTDEEGKIVMGIAATEALISAISKVFELAAKGEDQGEYESPHWHMIYSRAKRGES